MVSSNYFSLIIIYLNKEAITLVYRNINFFIRNYVLLEYERESDYYDWHYVAIHIFRALLLCLLSQQPDRELVLNPRAAAPLADIQNSCLLYWLLSLTDYRHCIFFWCPHIFLLAQFIWLNHAIHMSFPLSFIYLKRQLHPVYKIHTKWLSKVNM